MGTEIGFQITSQTVSKHLPLLVLVYTDAAVCASVSCLNECERNITPGRSVKVKTCLPLCCYRRGDSLKLVQLVVPGIYCKSPCLFFAVHR